MERRYHTIMQHSFATLCLLLMLNETIYASVAPFVSTTETSTETFAAGGGGEPVAEAASSMVDLYTGDFKYGVPLMNVPGPNGENVPISLNYHGGIRMDEKASWIGLGWDFNPGEISRQVIGAPDDYAGQPIISTNASLNDIRHTFTYGPFYYSAMNGTQPFPLLFTGSSIFNTLYTATDAFITEGNFKRGVGINSDEYEKGATMYDPNYNWSSNIPKHFRSTTAPFAMPAYDMYFASGPGIGGKLHPYIGNTNNLFLGKQAGLFAANTSVPGPQFFFEGSAKGYPALVPSGSSNYIKSGYFVKYYTNGAINSSGNLFNNSTQTGFLDYQIPTTTNRRDASLFDPTGIGGMQITTPDGTTYHYSLPVYTKQQVSKTLYHDPTYISMNHTTYKDADISYTHHPFATSWKLTAVTGADYFDSNNNKIADVGDEGYWIAYNYKKWTDNFAWSTSFYNYKDGFSPLGKGVFFSSSQYIYPTPTYQKSYSLTDGISQIYYLDNIQTPSHTAYFIKDIRLDEHSLPNGAGKVIPQMKLKRVILLNNLDRSVIENVTTSLTISSSYSNKFDLSSTQFASNALMHESKYQANKAAIDNKSLSSVELKTDYSLCRKLFNNVNNTNSTNAIVYNPANTTDPNPFALSGSALTTLMATKGSIFSALNHGSSNIYSYYVRDNSAIPSSNFSTLDYSNSGKLTLNEIVGYEDGGVKVFPSHVMEYDKNNVNKNPDYDDFKSDIWGFYKSDRISPANSQYPTPTSKADVDAWSLKSILLPTGAKIEIEYESDEISYSGFADDSLKYNSAKATATQNMILRNNRPKLIFPLYSAYFDRNTTNPSWSGYTYLRDFMFENTDFAALSNGYSSAGLISNGTYITVPILDGCINFNASTDRLAHYSSFYGTYTSVNNSTSPSPLFQFGGASYYSPGPSVQSGYEVIPDMSALCSSYYPWGLSGEQYDKKKGYGYAILQLKKMYGGGTRVKQVKFTDPSNSQNYTKKFSYEAGYCPVLPTSYDEGPVYTQLNNILSQNLKNLNPYGGTGSTVGYSQIIVKNVDAFNNSNGSVVYNYQNSKVSDPLSASLVNNSLIKSNNGACSNVCTTPGSGSDLMKNTTYTNSIRTDLSDAETSLLGKLKSVNVYGADNVLKATTSYEYTNESYVKEVYSHHNLNRTDIYTRQQYCSSPSGSSALCNDVENYQYTFSYCNNNVFVKKITNKLDGVTTVKDFNYDQTHGDVYETFVSSANNDGMFVTRYSYAYANYPGMGFKCDNLTNKHMLHAKDKVTTTKYSHVTYPGGSNSAALPSGYGGFIVSEAKTDFTNSFTVRTYNSSNGLYENVTGTKNYYTANKQYKRLLDDGVTSGTPVYRQESEVSLFDKRNHLVESKGLNNRKSSARFGYNYLFPLTAASNCNYGSYTFSSFEDTLTVANGVLHYGGEVRNGNTRTAALPGISPHTGNYMAKITGNISSLFVSRDFDFDRTYEVKVWVHKNAPSAAALTVNFSNFVDNSSNPLSITAVSRAKNDASNIQVGDWVLVAVEFTIPSNASPTAGEISIGFNSGSSLTSYIDDLMFHPVDIPISGSVYDYRTGRTIATLDAENFATFNNYDAAGRIVSQYKETKDYGVVKLLEKAYHNSRQ